MTARGPTAAARLAGQSELGRALDEGAVCTEVLPLEGNLFQISFQAPRLAGLAQPGEFAQIWVERSPVPLLRRPFSFSRADRRQGQVSFYLGAVGEGSRRLRRFHPGDRAQLLGPLGLGFTLPKEPGRSLLVAGGLGAAPFPLLADRLLERGEQVIWVNGARTRAELYPEELIPAGLAEVVQFTEDGSRGERGRVTSGLVRYLAGVQRVYACGPNSMLAVVFGLLSEHPARAATECRLEVSIEAPMGCGFGTCLGCAIPIRDPDGGHGPVIGLCCRQGPVLKGSLLDWEWLLRQPAHLG